MAITWELQVIKYYQQYKEVEEQLIKEKDLFGAMAHFRIARNFIGIREKKNKDELVEIINSVITNQSFSSQKKYSELLYRFKKRYKKELISATSKILWFVDSKEDFIIYDTLAIANLRKHRFLSIKDGEEKYFEFCDKWRDFYSTKEQQIESAVNRVKKFYESIPNFDNGEFEIMNKKWFRMRVLDMYLWNSN